MADSPGALADIRKSVKIGGSIVLFKNEPTEIQKVIASFFAQPTEVSTVSLELKLVLVDNSPGDDLRSLSGLDSRVEYIKSISNRGYGAGHNQAIRHFASWADFNLVLNPDITFGPNVLVRLATRMMRELDIGLIMPKIIYPDGTLQFAARLLPTPTNLLLRRFPLFKKLTESSNAIYELQSAKLDQSMEIPFLSGCFMFLRSSTLAAIGGFDERFFMYLEDTDLSRRIGDVAKTVYDPSVVIVHEHQKGSYKSARLMRIHIESAIKYFNKWGWLIDRVRRRRNALAKQRYLSGR